MLPRRDRQADNDAPDEHGSGSGSGGGSGGGNGPGTGPGSSKHNTIVKNGKILTPPYPPLSIDAGEEGKVIVAVVVAPGGRVESAKVSKSSGYRRLDNEARKAAQNGSYQATQWTTFMVPVNFELK